MEESATLNAAKEFYPRKRSAAFQGAVAGEN
jgi:hypothetical protein